MIVDNFSLEELKRTHVDRQRIELVDHVRTSAQPIVAREGVRLEISSRQYGRLLHALG
jgi:hypothetical protein